MGTTKPARRGVPSHAVEPPRRRFRFTDGRNMGGKRLMSSDARRRVEFHREQMEAAYAKVLIPDSEGGQACSQRRTGSGLKRREIAQHRHLRWRRRNSVQRAKAISIGLWRAARAV